MKYLEPFKLFIARKILLEAGDEPKEYQVINFWYKKDKTTNWKDILDFLFALEKENCISFGNIKIKSDFFSEKLGDFIEVDFNEETGQPMGGGLDRDAIKAKNFLGLGEKLFIKAEEEIAGGDGSFDSMIFEPDFSISKDELKSIDLSGSHLPYSKDIFKNLFFQIATDEPQKENLQKFLDNYIDNFQNDRLVWEGAEGLTPYKYKKQAEILRGVIQGIEKNYALRNRFLDDLKVYEILTSSYPSYEYIPEQFRLLDTILALEKAMIDEEAQEIIVIETMDINKGVGITRYDRDELLPFPVFKSSKTEKSVAIDLIKKQFEGGKKFVWRCRMCSDVLTHCETFEVFEELLNKFSESNPKTCKSGHKSWFFMKGDFMVFSVKCPIDDTRIFKA